MLNKSAFVGKRILKL